MCIISWNTCSRPGGVYINVPNSRGILPIQYFIQIAMNSGLILDREEQEDAHLAKASGPIQLGILVCCGIKQIGKWVLV